MGANRGFVHHYKKKSHFISTLSW